METHLNTYYMMTPFTLYRTRSRRASNDELLVYQTRLAAFLEASQLAGGDSHCYELTPARPAVPAVGNPGDLNHVPAQGPVAAVYEYRPTEPPTTVSITDGGNILRNTSLLTLPQNLHHGGYGQHYYHR